MSDVPISARRLSPSAKAGLSIFARYATILGLAAMIVVFSILSPQAFPTFNNFINVLNQASLAMIIAGGLTLAVVVGELDLSIGYAASLHGVLVTGLIVHDKLPIALAIAIVLALGALVGVVNGLIVTKLRVNSVIATLGVGTIIVGLAFAYSAGVPIVAGVPEGFLQLALGRWLFGIPNPIIVMALVMAALWALVERTSIGQEIQAVGGNPVAARLAGISVDRIKILGFVISGVCAALTGTLLASRLGSGTTSAADSYLLTAFAAVFLGSATLTRRRVPCPRHLHRHADHRVRLQRPQHFRSADLLPICVPGRDPDRRGRALESWADAGGKLRSRRWTKRRSGTSMSWNTRARRISRGSISSAACITKGQWTCPSRSSSRSATVATCWSTPASCRKITAPASRESSASRPGSRRSECWRR